jgi:hypothetical protein
MTEAEWLESDAPSWMVTCAARDRPRKLRLLVCAACRTVWDLLRDNRSRLALQNLEEYADNFNNARLLDAARSLSDAAWRALWNTQSGKAAAYAVYRAAEPARNLDLCDDVVSVLTSEGGMTSEVARHHICSLVRDVLGNPFRSVSVTSVWLTPDVLALARAMYELRDFSAMPILADALQDAGCDSDDILAHCRGVGPHVRGCWVVDLVLGKQ